MIAKLLCKFRAVKREWKMKNKKGYLWVTIGGSGGETRVVWVFKVKSRCEGRERVSEEEQGFDLKCRKYIYKEKQLFEIILII